MSSASDSTFDGANEDVSGEAKSSGTSHVGTPDGDLKPKAKDDVGKDVSFGHVSHRTHEESNAEYNLEVDASLRDLYDARFHWYDQESQAVILSHLSNVVEHQGKAVGVGLKSNNGDASTEEQQLKSAGGEGIVGGGDTLNEVTNDSLHREWKDNFNSYPHFSEKHAKQSQQRKSAGGEGIVVGDALNEVSNDSLRYDWKDNFGSYPQFSEKHAKQAKKGFYIDLSNEPDSPNPTNVNDAASSVASAPKCDACAPKPKKKNKGGWFNPKKLKAAKASKKNLKAAPKESLGVHPIFREKAKESNGPKPAKGKGEDTSLYEKVMAASKEYKRNGFVAPELPSLGNAAPAASQPVEVARNPSVGPNPSSSVQNDPAPAQDSLITQSDIDNQLVEVVAPTNRGATLIIFGFLPDGRGVINGSSPYWDDNRAAATEESARRENRVLLLDHNPGTGILSIHDNLLCDDSIMLTRDLLRDLRLWKKEASGGGDHSQQATAQANRLVFSLLEFYRYIRDQHPQMECVGRKCNHVKAMRYLQQLAPILFLPHRKLHMTTSAVKRYIEVARERGGADAADAAASGPTPLLGKVFGFATADFGAVRVVWNAHCLLRFNHKVFKRRSALQTTEEVLSVLDDHSSLFRKLESYQGALKRRLELHQQGRTMERNSAVATPDKRDPNPPFTTLREVRLDSIYGLGVP